MDTMDNFLESTKDSDDSIFEELSGYTDIDEETENTAEKEPEPSDDKEEQNSPPETDMVYSSQQVADIIKTTRQTVLNYTTQFSEFIRPSYDPKKQRYYSSTDLEVIRFISTLNKKRDGLEKIKEKLYLKFPELVSEQDQKSTLPAALDSGELMKKSEELADTISSKIEERIRNFFEIGMKGLYTRLDSVTDSFDGINDALQSQAEATARNESLARGIETAVSQSVDAINDLNRSVTSKVDRSISRNETSINKMQESLDRTNDLLTKDIKDKINKNIDGISGIQKDMERIKSNNISKKVDDLGRSLQESMSAEKKEREKQNLELFQMIEKAMTPPEYHPENSKEYKALNDKYNSINETFERSKSALMNMQAKIDEQEATIAKQEKRLSAQNTQMAACFSQIEKYKSRLKACEEENASFRELLYGATKNADISGVKNDTANEGNPERTEPLNPEQEEIPKNPAESEKDTAENGAVTDNTVPKASNDDSKEALRVRGKDKHSPDDLRGQILHNAEKPEKKGFLRLLFFH